MKSNTHWTHRKQDEWGKGPSLGLVYLTVVVCMLNGCTIGRWTHRKQDEWGKGPSLRLVYFTVVVCMLDGCIIGWGVFQP